MLIPLPLFEDNLHFTFFNLTMGCGINNTKAFHASLRKAIQVIVLQSFFFLLHVSIVLESILFHESNLLHFETIFCCFIWIEF